MKTLGQPHLEQAIAALLTPSTDVSQAMSMEWLRGLVSDPLARDA